MATMPISKRDSKSSNYGCNPSLCLTHIQPRCLPTVVLVTALEVLGIIDSSVRRGTSWRERRLVGFLFFLCHGLAATFDGMAHYLCVSNV